MTELQAAASRTISGVTGAEAGYVTAGASSALTLGVAAFIAGLDPGKMDRLPDTTGMKNEIIFSREQRTGYDHAIRLAGARLVEVGMNEQAAGGGVRRTEAWEYAAAVTPQTAGIAYAADPNARPPLAEVVQVAHRHGLPVLVDAAGELPPVSNLRAFIDIGVDLVAFSGGKAIRGPQSSGFLCGRREHIASVALQHLDMDEHFDIWDPPEDLIPKAELVGIPRHGIGRGFKVAKEEIAGLLTALRLFADGEIGSDIEEQRGYLEYVADGLSGLPAEPRLVEHAATGQPVLHLVLDSDALGMSAFDACRALKRGEPGVFPSEALLSEDTLVISPFNLDQRRTEALTERLRQVLSRRAPRLLADS
jgi:L-seryl-tRNA(Ser) seleniumtransferase